ncbi:hypothetical protein wcw_1022 [Waddlia chondrophila WSU 86-1044]|uniref:Uncharacterized protein n=2 Tax=Waddlia chondrophila TaxID=71667 RepID=D6YW70_WADCW|nr:hypothetical protein wcw_1022 [Waddlia chondrophila WSU 86-1044]
MKEFFKGFAASAAQVEAACVAKWAVVGAVSFFCPPLRAAVSSAITAYSVGMTAYSVGKCAYDNYDTLQEIGNAALAGDLGQIAAWGIDAVCSMSYEQLGSLAFDAVSIAALMARVKGAKAVADAKAASVAEKVEKAAKSTPVVKPTTPTGGIGNPAKKSGRNRFAPDMDAIGAHSVFRSDSINGGTVKYATYQF